MAMLPASHNFTLGSPGILGTLMAGALLGSIPVALVYSFFVDHYVSGLTAGAVKGYTSPSLLVLFPIITLENRILAWLFYLFATCSIL